jgi:hypothetical protein
MSRINDFVQSFPQVIIGAANKTHRPASFPNTEIRRRGFVVVYQDSAIIIDRRSTRSTKAKRQRPGWVDRTIIHFRRLLSFLPYKESFAMFNPSSSPLSSYHDHVDFPSNAQHAYFPHQQQQDDDYSHGGAMLYDSSAPIADDSRGSSSSMNEYERLLALQEELQFSGIAATTTPSSPSSQHKARVDYSRAAPMVGRTSSKDSIKKSGSGKFSAANVMMPGAFSVKNNGAEEVLYIDNSSGKKLSAATAATSAYQATTISTPTTTAPAFSAVTQPQHQQHQPQYQHHHHYHQPPPPVVRRSVRFDPLPPQENYDHGGWYFDDYAPSYWYNRADLEVFKNDRKNTVKALKRNNFDLYNVECQGFILRGFECYFSMEINKAFKYTRCLVVSLVKTEQDRQRHECRYNEPELIRESSMCASEWARDNALQLGVKDLEEVWPVDFDERQAHLFYIEDQVRDQQALYLAYYRSCVNNNNNHHDASPRKRKTDQPERPCIKNGRSGSQATSHQYFYQECSAESLVQPFADTHIG